jgi:hypothetical protein
LVIFILNHWSPNEIEMRTPAYESPYAILIEVNIL